MALEPTGALAVAPAVPPQTAAWLGARPWSDLLVPPAGGATPAATLRAWLRSQGAAAWLALGGVGLAEWLAAWTDPRWGMGLHVVLLVAFLLLSVLGRDAARQTFYLSLTLAPLIRVVSLGMPLGELPQLSWYVLSATPLLASAWVIVRLSGLSRAEIAVRWPRPRHLPLEAAVALSGLVLGVAEYLILRPEPLVPGAGLPVLVGAGLVLLVGTGVLEEVIFRGILQRTAGALFRPAVAIGYVSLLFGVLHFGHGSYTDVVFVSAVAVYFGWVVARTGSILGVTVAHGVTNTMLFVVLPRLLG